MEGATSTQSMKVLFVIHTPKDPLTAVYGNVIQRGQFLSEQGHQVQIVTPDDFSFLSRVSIRWYILFYPLILAVWLLRHGKDCNVVIFHSYSGWLFNYVFRIVPSIRHICTITSFHGLEPLAYLEQKAEALQSGQSLSLRYRLMNSLVVPRFLRWTCRRSNLVTCLNSGEAAFLSQHGWGEQANIVITPNAVDRSFFVEKKITPNAHRLLFVGQWLPRKGITYLVKAFVCLAAREKDAELWCVGTLLNEEKVRDSFPADLRERVKVRARVSREDIHQIYQEADIFVFPTLLEGASLALLEAMATGLPIITTPVGSAPDMLISGVSALLISKYDSAALTDAIQQLLGDADLRERLGRQAQTTAWKYEYAFLYREFTDLLEKMVLEARLL